MINIGSRSQVMRGTANKTSGGLTKSQLKYNKQGKIVSKKASALAKKNNRLVKAGYITRKGQFGCEMKGGVENIEMVYRPSEAVTNTPPKPKENTFETIVLDKADGVQFKDKDKWVPVKTFKIFAPPYQVGKDEVVIKVTFEPSGREPIEFKLLRINPFPYHQTLHNKLLSRERFDIRKHNSEFRFSIKNNSHNLDNMKNLFEEIKIKEKEYRDYCIERNATIRTIVTGLVNSRSRNNTFNRFTPKEPQNVLLLYQLFTKNNTFNRFNRFTPNGIQNNYSPRLIRYIQRNIIEKYNNKKIPNKEQILEDIKGIEGI